METLAHLNVVKEQTMIEQWKRKDYSKDSKIRDTLLKDLLAYRRKMQREIPEEYEEQIAAAGISQGEQAALEEWEKEKKSNGYKFQ